MKLKDSIRYELGVSWRNLKDILGEAGLWERIVIIISILALISCVVFFFYSYFLFFCIYLFFLLIYLILLLFN